MIEVSQATQIILENAGKLPLVKIPIQKSPGRILMEDIKADTDFPPFDKVMMDGIAIRFSAFRQGRREFKIQGIQAAGIPPLELKNADGCLEAMTGAVLPIGCDTIIQYEYLEIDKNAGIVNIINDDVVQGKNIHYRGTDKKDGDLLLEKGRKISAAEVAIFASVGKTEVRVSKLPRIAIISTGDELVDIHEKPLPHQIRRSNIYAIQAELYRMGIKSGLFHLKDNKADLLTSLAAIIDEHDVLLMSGGVSMGKFDYLPEVLQELGITQLFHKIRQKPGKPFWFGVKGNKTVFAFPGNPVSTFLCFHRYFKPWLIKSLGREKVNPSFAALSEDVEVKSDITFFLQVGLAQNKEGILIAYPRRGQGSGDHANLLESDGFLELSGDRNYKRGMVFPVYPFR